MKNKNINTNNKKVCWLDHERVIKISGTGAAQFLQGQVSCNIDNLNNNYIIQWGCCCNAAGRVQALFRIFKHPQESTSYYLACAEQVVNQLYQRLCYYSKFSRLSITILDPQSLGLGIIIDTDNDINILKNINIFKNANIIAAPISNNLFACYGLADFKILYKIYDSLLDLGYELFSVNNYNYWKYQLIINKLPEIYSETYEKFLPHDLNLDQHPNHIIDFNKGCYTGQEIIARMHYRAKIKKRLYLAKLNINNNTQPVYGEDIINSANRLVGEVVDFYDQSVLITLKTDLDLTNLKTAVSNINININ